MIYLLSSTSDVAGNVDMVNFLVPLVTIVAAVFCAAIMLALSCFISYLRVTKRVSLGDGGNYLLARTVRAHANAAEFIPISLLLLLLAEYAGVQTICLWIGAGMLMLGRFLHAWGLIAKRLTLRRQIGALLNYVFLLYFIVLLLLQLSQ